MTGGVSLARLQVMPPAERSRQSAVAALGLFIFVLANAYLGVSLPIGGRLYVPYILVLLAVPLLLIYTRRGVYRRDAVFFLAVAGVWLATIVFSPGYAFIGEKFLGFGQTSLSLLTGILVWKLVDQIDDARLARAFFVVLLVLFVGTALEVAGVLKGASDAFRHGILSREDWAAYENLERDVNLLGFERPKFFAVEPSVLAAFFLVVTNCWLILRTNGRNFVVAAVATAAMFLMNGSPTLLLSLVVSVFVLVSQKSARPAIIYLVPLGVLGLLALPFIGAQVIGSLAERFDLGLVYDLRQGIFPDKSIAYRLVYPYITVWDTAKYSPLVGVGLSGKEVIDSFTRFPSGFDAFGNNNFAAVFTYLGLGGGFAFLFLLYGYLKRVTGARVMFLSVILVLLAQTMGGFEAARFWVYVFTITAVVRRKALSEWARERTLGLRNGSENGRK